MTDCTAVGYTFNMKNNPITVYWSPLFTVSEHDKDWSFMYPKPKTLFKSTKEHTNKHELLKHDETDLDHANVVLACPAVSAKFKKIIVFENPVNCKYSYDFTDPENGFFTPTTKEYIDTKILRKPMLNYGPCIYFSLEYVLFSDEPLEVSFTPPMFHPPQYMQHASVIPGDFNIGRWFRPYTTEFQFWKESGEFALKEGEPLFYAEFKTERPVVLKRFKMNLELKRMSLACIQSYELFGSGQSLEEKYNKFEEADMQALVLNEIKKNIVVESKELEV